MLIKCSRLLQINPRSISPTVTMKTGAIHPLMCGWRKVITGTCVCSLCSVLAPALQTPPNLAAVYAKGTSRITSPLFQAHSCPPLPLPRHILMVHGHTLPWAITAGDKHSCTIPFPVLWHTNKLHQLQRRSCRGSATEPSVIPAKPPNTAVPQFPFLEAGTHLRGTLGGFCCGKG